MKVRVRVEDERTGMLIRQYDGVDWRLLEPVRRVDAGVDVAERVGEATELVGDLLELFSGRRAKRRRRIKR